MPAIQNRLAIKQNLLSQIEQLKNKLGMLNGSPLTDLEIQPEAIKTIENLTLALEQSNPFPRPLLHASNLLDGAWLLQYSTAREIRSLKRLPLGFVVGKIYQTIDLNHASFENRALVDHRSGLLSGYVRVTATFEPALEQNSQLPEQKINIDFKQRFLGIKQILGIKTNWFDPIKVVEARNPKGRIPSLDLTYIDQTMRIGRGGDNSLYILTKE